MGSEGQWSSKLMLRGHMQCTFNLKLLTWACFLIVLAVGAILESFSELNMMTFLGKCQRINHDI